MLCFSGFRSIQPHTPCNCRNVSGFNIGQRCLSFHNTMAEILECTNRWLCPLLPRPQKCDFLPFSLCGIDYGSTSNAINGTMHASCSLWINVGLVSGDL